ncbi:MAG TPA: DUF3341 domain-containing protein [Thermoanaerobaculaceae bacterium]|nr:DUF3341 domain-containing protein [Thermoanaerobaculaceae bacterium]HRS16632.1 DUF3341 domain-containing protein [Thermoanaerobaculaceae bacterium]
MRWKPSLVPELPDPGRLWGVLAEFDSVEALLAAAEKVRAAGFSRWDVHTPIPIHGLDEAMGIRPSPIPWLALGGGVTGAAAGLLLQWFTNAFDYPFLVSGKPLFGLPVAVPVTFELTILLASLGAVGSLFVFCGWPQLHHPLFANERFARASSDRFFISIEAADPRFDETATKWLLEDGGARAVEEVRA